MTDFQSRLQSAVGDTYRIESELGGGGMSRVFVAEELELGRKVVIKVLPPEMGAGVNQDRFRREIQLAAKLQHPHVVPLLTAGSHDDLLYYVMPLIEGESLRAKLAREGELPVGEAVHILREVCDALAYAHQHGVVHRDIKPDNVLISGEHALVTDFGVAKAVSESTGSRSLTSIGVALGTPAYMSPEQAAANPHIDHRSDIYAVGALAYEMLSGRPPFDGPNPQTILSAHVTQEPDPLTARRATTPAALSELVMRCLAKLPADRWQQAEDLKHQFDTMTTPSGGVTPTGAEPVISSGTEAAIRQAHPARVAALFGLSAIGVLALVYGLVIQFGLPNWVMFGAAVLLVVGLPIMMVTGHHEQQRAQARTTGLAIPTPTGIELHFTWRKALTGGGLAFGGLGVAAAAYMAMRVLGIGPVGTLIASGVMPEASRAVLADFVNRTADTTLGATLTEALRVDLSQSEVLRLMDGSGVNEGLARMGRSANDPLDQAVALELAQREGAAAVVVGEIGPLGQAYVISARLLAAEDGAELFSERRTADTDAALIDAVDALSARLRERIGESLRSIRAQPRLAQVTTSSLEALRRYTAHLEHDREGRYEQAIALLREAVAIDTTFAMAYRRLAVIYSNTRDLFSLEVEAARRAFEFRDRLGERERLQVTAYYYTTVRDREGAILTYRQILDRWPNNLTALNNLALQLRNTGRAEEAESLAQRAVDSGGVPVNYLNLVLAQLVQGNVSRAESTMATFEREWPNHPVGLYSGLFVAAARRDYSNVESIGRIILGIPAAGSLAVPGLIGATVPRGRLALAEDYARQLGQLSAGRADLQLLVAALPALIDVLSRDAPEAGLRKMAAALERHPIDNLHPLDRPYLALADFYALAGRSDLARDMLADLDRELADAEVTLRNVGEIGVPSRFVVEGHIAVAEDRPADAIAAFRMWADEGGCSLCGAVEIGRAFEVLGDVDSALAAYETAVTAPLAMFEEAFTLAPTYRRLGELYEQRADIPTAVDYYNRFVELWDDADAELQPQVADVRGRIARLVGEGR